MANTGASPDYRQDLGDGLVLRWSTAADTEKIAYLLSTVFRGADDPPNPRAADAGRRFMGGEMGAMSPDSFCLVEDTHRSGHPAVACACLLRGEWCYEGIPFRIAQPEMVGSDRDYRHRGLVRAIFQTLHARSAAEGHLLQAVDGIPYFYQQLGYAYGLDLAGSGRHATPLSLIPKAPEGEPEAFALRPAVEADLPLIEELYERRARQGVVWACLPESWWRYRIESWRRADESGEDVSQLGLPDRVVTVVDASGAARGFAYLNGWRRGRALAVLALELDPRISLLAAMPSLLRALRAYGESLPVGRPDAEPLAEIHFCLGRNHPIYDALGRGLSPVQEPPYAWYVRIADLIAFLRHIAPALEQRLVGSVAAGHTGELHLNLYRSGVRLAFEAGRIAAIEPWLVAPRDAWGAPPGEAGLPPWAFLQLLLGYRSLDALREMNPDVWASREGELLLKALFQARPSWVAPRA